MTQSSVKKLAILAMMIALDVVLSPLFRIEGMAPCPAWSMSWQLP